MMKKTPSINNCKSDFPLFANHKSLVYLDSAATSQKPQSVIDAEKQFYETTNANVHRGIYKLSEQATHIYETARKKVSAFIGAEPDEIVFTKNATESINLVMYSWGMHNVSKGDNVVVSILEHHSNFVPWQQLCKAKGAELRVIGMNSTGGLNYNEAEKLIDEKTQLIAVTHISNAIGSIVDIKKIIKIAKKHSSLVLIDASQSVPHMQVNFKELNADFMVFSGHKMLGPTGIGVLAGKKHLLESMNPFIFGGGMIGEVSITNTSWQESPYKFEAGTPNIAGAAGLSAAVDYINKIGIKNIEARDKKLTQYALVKLSSIKNVEIIGKPQAGIISFNVKNMHAHDISSLLDRKNICIRAGHHCCQPLMKSLGITSTCRISFHIYNSEKDIDLLCSSLVHASKVLS